MTRAKELSRTTALYRADLGINSDAVVDAVLRRINVLLAIGHPASSTRAGQAAVLTAALLLARTGFQVFIQAVDGPLVGHQPPFEGASLHEAVLGIQGELVEGSNIRLGAPDRVDVAFDFGTASAIAPYEARRTVHVGWTAWSGEISDWPFQVSCTEFDWPMGAMAAAVMVAAEVAKMAARRLAPLSADGRATDERFAASSSATFVLAEESTPRLAMLGEFTAISAGAVSNGLFYALSRLPGVHGRATVFDGDTSDPSNLNRNMMLSKRYLRDAMSLKVELLAHLSHGLKVLPVPRAFVETDLSHLAGRVAVGVDHVPSRWLLARARYDWMGVGATSHFDVLNSVHYPISGCCACLHPHDEPGPPITPTIAHTSFLAGLLLATDLIVDAAGATAALSSRQRYVYTTAFGREHTELRAGIFPRSDCPAKCAASQIKRTG
ncbi:MAG TPA: hypothetical protein VEB68_01540 [Croceibacterium sp.]|nr:hypothetical protein [Croceibacterium sp.]